MTPKEVFLEDLKKEQMTTGLPTYSDQIMYRVGVSVMRHHSNYFKPLKLKKMLHTKKEAITLASAMTVKDLLDVRHNINVIIEEKIKTLEEELKELDKKLQKYKTNLKEAYYPEDDDLPF